MNEMVAVAGVIGICVGFGIAAFAVLAMLATQEPASRTRAYGFVLLGFSVAVACTAVYAVARLDDPLPLAAGVPIVAFLLAYSLRLRLASAKALRRSRSHRGN